MESVRIDKFLWAIRVFKTRSEAAEACKGNRVKVNDADAKPSRDVKVGDVITVRKAAVYYKWKVLGLIENRVGAQLVPQYAENQTPQEELDKLKAPVETFFVKRDRGTGRPTKKDRRTIDAMWGEIDFNAELPDDPPGYDDIDL
mgnify:FL=1